MLNMMTKRRKNGKLSEKQEMFVCPTATIHMHPFMRKSNRKNQRTNNATEYEMNIIVICVISPMVIIIRSKGNIFVRC